MTLGVTAGLCQAPGRTHKHSDRHGWTLSAPWLPPAGRPAGPSCSLSSGLPEQTRAGEPRRPLRVPGESHVPHFTAEAGHDRAGWAGPVDSRVEHKLGLSRHMERSCDSRGNVREGGGRCGHGGQLECLRAPLQPPRPPPTTRLPGVPPASPSSLPDALPDALLVLARRSRWRHRPAPRRPPQAPGAAGRGRGSGAWGSKARGPRGAHGLRTRCSRGLRPCHRPGGPQRLGGPRQSQALPC